MDDRKYNTRSSAGENCVFYVGDDEYKQLMVKVNKQLLVAKSSVFEKMFQGSLPEKDVVKVTDVSPEAFIIVLKYLRGEPYYFNLKELAVDVLHAAEKYEILELKHVCEDFLLPKTVADVWWVAPYAYSYNSTKLQIAIRHLLSKHTSAFIFDDNFLDASEELVLDIVQLDSVEKVTEVEIFKAIVDWAEHQLLKKGVTLYDGKMLYNKLQNVLKHVRFDVFFSQDQPAPLHFIRIKEAWEVFQLHCKAEKKSNEPDEIDEGELSSEGEEYVPSKRPPRKETPASNENELLDVVDVVARKPADVSLCYRKNKLQESVSVVQKADLVSIILPSKLASADNKSTNYLEDIHVFVTYVGYVTNNRSNCEPKEYGFGLFKDFVCYGQEIQITVDRRDALTDLTVSNQHPLTYYLTIYFKCQGVYPWQSTRIFSANTNLGKVSSDEAGCVIGYRFRPR